METLIGAHQALDLPDPTCQGSISAASDGLLLSSSAYNKDARVNGTLSASKDGGESWYALQVIDSFVFAYSALADLNDTHVAVLYETEFRGQSGIVYTTVPKKRA